MNTMQYRSVAGTMNCLIMKSAHELCIILSMNADIILDFNNPADVIQVH